LLPALYRPKIINIQVFFHPVDGSQGGGSDGFKRRTRILFRFGLAGSDIRAACRSLLANGARHQAPAVFFSLAGQEKPLSNPFI
jgi:hypothetical protein